MTSVQLQQENYRRERLSLTAALPLALIDSSNCFPNPIGDETSSTTGNGGMGHSVAYGSAETNEGRLKVRNLVPHDDSTMRS